MHDIIIVMDKIKNGVSWKDLVQVISKMFLGGGFWNSTRRICMWPPLTNIWRNHDYRYMNKNTGCPRNVALIGTIPNTYESR